MTPPPLPWYFAPCSFAFTEHEEKYMLFIFLILSSANSFHHTILAMIIWTLLLAFVLQLNNIPIATVSASSDDLYSILGVKRTATTKEIKTAYRRKALDTHPDKNKGIPAEEAAASFHKVVHAFEVLSDKDSRRRYDQTGDSSNQQQQQRQQQNQYSWSFTWSNGRRRIRLKDKFEVKEAQSRILHIVSLEQLETVIVDEDENVLERNLLICFLTPQIEEHVMDEMVYPYPFAGMSSQGIWWEDLLQTTSVRFHRSNTLTEFFDIPMGDTLNAPMFVFGKRGQPFTKESAKSWPRLQTDDRMTFDRWTWDMIKVEVEFVNEHNHPVEIYWIHGTRANWKMKMEPGERVFHETSLSHEWWVRDLRVDTWPGNRFGRGRLTKESMLRTWKITSDEVRQRLVIPQRHCYDLSGHCPFWEHKGECRKNPAFMEEQCRLTCGHCESDEVVEEKNGTDEGQGNDEL